MQKKKNWLAMFAWTMTILFIIAGSVAVLKSGSIPEGYLGPEDINLAVSGAVIEATEPLNTEITTLKQEITDLKTEEEEMEEKTLLGYLIDELFLGSVFAEDVFSDREVSTLFDGEVEFDGKDYDAEETFVLKDVELVANGNDFEGVPYMTFPEGAIEYKLEFETDLNTNLIDDDETLTFNFLGKEVTVSEWIVGNEVTFSQGEEHLLTEGSSVTINGKVVALTWVGSGAVYVTVDGDGAKIFEGKTKKISGLEIKAEDVLYTEKSGSESKAILVIGDEVSFEVENGEEYAEDSIWEWRITESSIGLVLVEEFMELDEDFNALAPGESICLPNDYVCVVYNGVVEEDSEVYTFELDGDFVEVIGNFEYGTKDYDKIYIHNETGLIYEDDNTDDLIGEEVKLGDTKMTLVFGVLYKVIRIGNDEFFNEFVVSTNLQFANANKNSDNLVDWDCNGEDENFLTDYGILVENPEDSCEDQEFRITVPEERLEASVSIVG